MQKMKMKLSQTAHDVLALVTALVDDETAGGLGIPESMLYLTYGMDIRRSNRTCSAAIRAGYVSIEGNLIRLTAKGKAIADRVNATLHTSQDVTENTKPKTQIGEGV